MDDNGNYLPKVKECPSIIGTLKPKEEMTEFGPLSQVKDTIYNAVVKLSKQSPLWPLSPEIIARQCDLPKALTLRVLPMLARERRTPQITSPRAGRWIAVSPRG